MAFMPGGYIKNNTELTNLLTLSNKQWKHNQHTMFN